MLRYLRAKHRGEYINFKKVEETGSREILKVGSFIICTFHQRLGLLLRSNGIGCKECYM